MADQPRPAWARGESVFDVSRSRVLSLPMLTPEWAWGGATGKGVRVAVIDSGIEAGHPRLEGCVDEQGGMALELDDDGQIVEHPGPHEDLFGHGTACAAIIHELAPEARITSIRVLGERLSGKAQVFLHALAWAIEQGFDVINLSLGTPKRDWALPFYEICDQAYFRGCFMVTAANNQPVVSFPSLFGSVTSVACNVATDPFEFHFNPDPPTEFLARGIDVDLAWKDGTSIRATGNSFAAPHISGIAALILSKHPQLRPFQVKATLWATAANLPGEARTGAFDLSGVIARPGATSARAMSALHSVVQPREPGA
jgi:subtilisin family serine protease